MAVPTRAEVEAMVAERISADPGFRAALEADPRGVLGDLIGIEIPEAVQVELHEESLTQIHLTIPAADSLTDADLDLVAGGLDWSLNSGYTCNCGFSG